MAMKHRKKTASRGLKVALVSVVVLSVVGGGTAYAAYRYDRSSANRILPGVSVDGVDLGWMTRDEAIRVLKERADLRLADDLAVQAAGVTWTVTPAALGMSADVEGAVDRALAVADDMSFFSRVYHRLANEPVDTGHRITYLDDEDAIRAFVEQAYDEVAVPPRDALIALEDGELVTRRSRAGREIKVGLAAQRILKALARQVDAVDIPVREITPSVTTASLGTSIVVDISDNSLRLYRGLRVVKEYRVATGTPGYPTPVGTFEIVDKKENPTWYNPALDGWGADLPPFIGPGPGNPLGTRAMYLNAPGIRIHGTWDSSSIGTAASHGCIRMHIEDAEELYPLVPMGARVLVVP
jgi:lipoprotein-anchoring transpeptidase ErfK/SrfK